MTISMAWVRQRENHQELVFASDSRLSGDGRLFDSCPKILTLPRNDCAIAFSGYTGDAFPMMLQLSLAIDSHNPSKHSELKLSTLKEHAIQVFNGMARTIRSSVIPKQEENPSAQFLFGGYSWFRKAFQIWQISYHSKTKTFVADALPWVGYRKEFNSIGWSYSGPGKSPKPVKRMGQIGIIGDAPQVKAAKQLLASRLKEKASTGNYTLDMEPFKVIRDMLRDVGGETTIGGAPQIVIVHQYMQATPVGIYWPDKTANVVYIQGRRTLDYENIDRYVLDPDTLELHSPYLPQSRLPDHNTS